MWYGTPLALRTDTFPCQSIIELRAWWLDPKRKQESVDFPSMVGCFAESLWHCRYHVLVKGFQPNPVEVLQRVKDLSREFNTMESSPLRVEPRSASNFRGIDRVRPLIFYSHMN